MINKKTSFSKLSVLLLLYVVSEKDNEKDFEKGNGRVKKEVLDELFIQNINKLYSNSKTEKLKELEGIGIIPQEERLLIGKLIVLVSKSSRSSKDLLEIERFAILLTPSLRDYKDNILEEIPMGLQEGKKKTEDVQQSKEKTGDGDFEV